MIKIKINLKEIYLKHYNYIFIKYIIKASFPYEIWK